MRPVRPPNTGLRDAPAGHPQRITEPGDLAPAVLSGLRRRFDRRRRPLTHGKSGDMEFKGGKQDQPVPKVHASVAGACVRGQPEVICFPPVFFFRGTGRDRLVPGSWIVVCGSFRLTAITV